MGWMFVSFQNLYVEMLTPPTPYPIVNVMLLGDETFGKWLGLDEVVTVELSWMEWVPLQESEYLLLLSILHHVSI